MNGSFESPAVANDSWNQFTTVSGWTALTGGQIEVWRGHRGVTATNGVNFLELDFAGARDGFFQDVTTVAGQTYNLSFDLRTRPGFAASTQGVEIVWNGVVIATATPGTDWSTFTVALTGTGTVGRLTIREVAGQAGDGIGAMLDNFVLIAAPGAEPSAQAEAVDPLAVAAESADIRPPVVLDLSPEISFDFSDIGVVPPDVVDEPFTLFALPGDFEAPAPEQPEPEAPTEFTVDPFDGPDSFGWDM